MTARFKRDVGRGARVHAPLDVRVGPQGRDENDGCGGVAHLLPNALDELDTVDAGHLHVGEDDAVAVLLQQVQGPSEFLLFNKSAQKKVERALGTGIFTKELPEHILGVLKFIIVQKRSCLPLARSTVI